MKTFHRPTCSRLLWIAELCCGALLVALPDRGIASGVYGPPPRWLEEGGRKSLGTPEFFWDLELRRIAAELAEKDAFVFRPTAERTWGSIADQPPPLSAGAATAAADAADFADALQSGRLQPADPVAAQAAHLAVRAWLDEHRKVIATEIPSTVPGEPSPPTVEHPPADPPAPGAPSEFADYHAGCLAKDPEEAMAAWERLLQRPASERHYRSVWAAFMIGKTRLEKDAPEAVSSFQRCRSLVREGFADTLGLAADSYGWEAMAELRQRHFPAAARLYLQQLALGDSGAIISLRRVVPATLTALQDGYVADLTTEDSETSARWLEAAGDPVLRRIVTAHVLATETGLGRAEVASPRCLRWLRAVEEVGLGKIEDAAPLGWTAYTTGNYEEAARWLGKESAPTPLGRWLRAKLALRSGNFTEAARLMPKVIEGLPPDEGLRVPADYTYLPRAAAQADLAAAHLAAGRFSEALESWYLGFSDSDAAHLAERVLTTKELGAFIAKTMPQAPGGGGRADADGRWPEEFVTDATPNPWPLERIQARLRSIYGRRLIREGRIREARPFLTDHGRAALDRYLAAMARAENKKLSRVDRARARFEAALVMRRDGPEFRGTIEEFNDIGMSPSDPLVAERLTGEVIVRTRDAETDEPRTHVETARLAPTREERRRLTATAPQRAKSNRTTLLAAALAKQAAALLPDNTEELADVLNTAGDWIEDLDNAAADRIYYQLEARCPETQIGRAALAKHWFTREPGPWSGAADGAQE